MIRAFIALPLPAALRDRLSVVQQMLPLSRRVPPENFHVTLAFLGDQPGAALEQVHDGLAALAAAAPPLEITSLSAFGGDKPRVIHAEIAPAPALLHLQSRVARIAADAGIRLEHRRFIPHVTLSRDRPRGPAQMRLEQAIAQLGALHIGPEPARTVTLYRSILRPDGPVYDALEDYPFPDPR